MSKVPSTIQFDVTRALRHLPKRMLWHARTVEKPVNEVTDIMTKFGGLETFVGTYVEMLNPETNDVVCAFNPFQFARLHTPWEGIENGWYYSDPVDAYQSDIECKLLIGLGNGIQHVHVGDWICRYSDGQARSMSAEDFAQFYDLDSARPVPREPE